MPKKTPVSVEIVEKGDERFVVSTFADGTVTRTLVVKTKPTRRPMRPHHQLIDRTKKKRF
jgi:hypothetical protein